MSERRCRPLAILDGMVIVAAVACGVALARTIARDAGPWPWFDASLDVARPGSYFLLPPTLALIALRLRRPRPSLRRVLIQPGMAACCAVAVITAVDAVSWLIYGLQVGSEGRVDFVARYWRGNWGHPAWGVAAVCLALVLGRRWRRERGWIDGFGRLLGVLWMLTLLCDWPFGRWTLNLTYRFLGRG